MTETERDALGGYVREIADLIELRDWRFGIDSRPADEDCDAQIQCTYGRKFGNIRLSHGWGDMEPEIQRHTVIHELLHAHLEPVSQVIVNVQANLGDQVFGVVRDVQRDATEFAVDAIADALAPHLPLPPTIRASGRQKGGRHD